MLISRFHSNKFVSYACVCVYVCVRMCVCTLALVCAYLCACAYRVRVCSLSRKNICCTFYTILCNFLFIVLKYCTNKGILCNKQPYILPNLLKINALQHFYYYCFSNLLIFKHLQIIFVFSQKSCSNTCVFQTFVIPLQRQTKGMTNKTKVTFYVPRIILHITLKGRHKRFNKLNV